MSRVGVLSAALIVLCCTSSEERPPSRVPESGVTRAPAGAVADSEREAAETAEESPAIPALLDHESEREAEDRTSLGEIEILATTFNPRDDLPDDLPLYPVTYDPHMVLVLRVDEILGGGVDGGGEPPFVVGEEVGLLVHSPALMFGGYGFSGRQFVYTFEVARDTDGALSYSLVALDTWPRSRPR